MRARRERRSPVSSIVTVVLVLAAAAWVWGFLGFIDSVPREPDPGETATDAIVVLTGGSERLAGGLALLMAGKARKLFVSGVYRGVDVAELLRVAETDAELVANRIALGHEAGDTRGNALETAVWMAGEGFHSLRLVTAAYHMPRSQYEFSVALPDAEIVPHPVFPAHVPIESWWLYPGTATLLASEYSKLLLARARVALFAFLDDPSGWLDARFG